MEPLTVILWALCLGLAWLEFAGMTGAGEAQGGTNPRGHRRVRHGNSRWPAIAIASTVSGVSARHLSR